MQEYYAQPNMVCGKKMKLRLHNEVLRIIKEAIKNWSFSKVDGILGLPFRIIYKDCFCSYLKGRLIISIKKSWTRECKVLQKCCEEKYDLW